MPGSTLGFPTMQDEIPFLEGRHIANNFVLLPFYLRGSHLQGATGLTCLLGGITINSAFLQSGLEQAVAAI